MAEDQDKLKEELKALQQQVREDRKLISKAADALAEIDRGPTDLPDHIADVLAALRIRVEGKPRKSLDEVLSAAGEIRGSKPDLGDAIQDAEGKEKTDWPEIEDKPKEWPTL